MEKRKILIEIKKEKEKKLEELKKEEDHKITNLSIKDLKLLINEINKELSKEEK